MNNFHSHAKHTTWSIVLLLGTLAAGCSGGEGQGQILGPDGLGNSGALAADVTRPRVTFTQPATTSPGPTAGVPANTSIAAVFSEEMLPATITAAGAFTVSCSAACVSPTPAGTVAYTAGTRTATFTPSSPPLETGKTYTVTIKGTGVTPATDLAGNALGGNTAPLPAASDYVWSFVTVAPIAAAPVTVSSTNPADTATGVCPGSGISATFSSPGFRMDPATVNTTTFTLTGPGSTPVAAQSVVLDDATGLTATYKSQGDLINGVTYTATIMSGASGVKDLAAPANQMAADKVWTFTVGPATGACAQQAQAQAINLATAATFGGMGGTAGTTNQGTLTVINGDIATMAVSTAVTGFHDGGPGCTLYRNRFKYRHREWENLYGRAAPDGRLSYRGNGANLRDRTAGS